MKKVSNPPPSAGSKPPAPTAPPLLASETQRICYVCGKKELDIKSLINRLKESNKVMEDSLKTDACLGIKHNNSEIEKQIAKNSQLLDSL